jgi:ribosomal protein S27AE
MDARMINGKIIEFGKRCPSCNQPDLEPITDHNFIAEHGDVWQCGHCMINKNGSGLWTDFAVKMYNKQHIARLREFGYTEEANALEEQK